METDTLPQTLRDLDQAIDSAISNRDAAVLNSVLAEDFVYTHSNGRSQSKADFIAGVTGRTDPPRRILSDVQVEQHEDIAVTRGNLDIRYEDARPDLYMRYVRVYRALGPTWRAISHRTLYAIDRKPSS